jgi:hypothetical protein
MIIYVLTRGPTAKIENCQWINNLEGRKLYAQRQEGLLFALFTNTRIFKCAIKSKNRSFTHINAFFMVSANFFFAFEAFHKFLSRESRLKLFDKNYSLISHPINVYINASHQIVKKLWRKKFFFRERFTFMCQALWKKIIILSVEIGNAIWMLCRWQRKYAVMVQNELENLLLSK